MGRCYEFGVSVHDGCEQAMVVAHEGGHCTCAACGAACPGRFKGCAIVVAQPGYVPLSAPVWARPGAAAAPPDALPARLGSSPPQGQPDWDAAVEPAQVDPPMREPATLALRQELTTVRSLLEALLDRPERAVDAVQALNHQLAVRDGELGESFDRLTEAYQRLTNELVADREARQALVAAVDRVAERLASVEEAQGRPLFGFRRPAG